MNYSNDSGRQFLLDHVLIDQELRKLNALQTSLEETPSRPPQSALGISIIVPSYLGEDRIPQLLNSIQSQTLSPTHFELVIITNGQRDGSAAILEQFSDQHPAIRLQWLHRETPSAGGARNLGLALASLSHVTFVDDDDELEPEFLESAFNTITKHPDDIAVAPIINISSDASQSDANNPLNKRIRDLASSRTPIEDIPWLLGFNACKFIPIALARSNTYDEALVSGEDLVYFASLLKMDGIHAAFPSDTTNNAYLRHLRDNSISRQQQSYEFNVKQRIACIRALQDIETTKKTASARDQLVAAQAGFIARYLADHPDQVDRASHDIATAKITRFPWKQLNSGKARDLAISYCFAPFSDTSAVVAAKAIAERQRIVDVISNDMSKIRSIDPDVSALADRWIDGQFIVQETPSFAGWEPISRFANEALNVAERNHALKGGYETLYSRALWVGSHVAAALFKSRHWDVTWTAEFSDPLRYDAEGNHRNGDFISNSTSEQLLRAITARIRIDSEPETVFDLVELATLILADELIFTNENQMEYMLGKYSDARITNLARSKSIVRHHPVPPAEAYSTVDTDYVFPETAINIGYFGSFYPNRGIDMVLTAIENLTLTERRRLRLHVFCNRPKEFSEVVANRGITANVYVNPYLPYMEFLNATTKLDILLVNDVSRPHTMEVNPFLPSKYSDYLGSHTAIWKLVDDNSPLSKESTKYTSSTNDPADVHETLRQILNQEMLNKA